MLKAWSSLNTKLIGIHWAESMCLRTGWIELKVISCIWNTYKNWIRLRFSLNWIQLSDPFYQIPMISLLLSYTWVQIIPNTNKLIELQNQFNGRNGLCHLESVICWPVGRGGLLGMGWVIFGVWFPCDLCGWFGGSGIVGRLKIPRGPQWSWRWSSYVLCMIG